MVYITAIPAPSGAETTVQPVSSGGVHLTVEAFARSNPGGVLPLAIGMPIALAGITLLLRRRWRKDTNPNPPSEPVALSMSKKADE